MKEQRVVLPCTANPWRGYRFFVGILFAALVVAAIAIARDHNGEGRLDRATHALIMRALLADDVRELGVLGYDPTTELVELDEFEPGQPVEFAVSGGIDGMTVAFVWFEGTQRNDHFTWMAKGGEFEFGENYICVDPNSKVIVTVCPPDNDVTELGIGVAANDPNGSTVYIVHLRERRHVRSDLFPY